MNSNVTLSKLNELIYAVALTSQFRRRRDRRPKPTSAVPNSKAAGGSGTAGAGLRPAFSLRIITRPTIHGSLSDDFVEHFLLPRWIFPHVFIEYPEKLRDLNAIRNTDVIALV